MPYAIELFLDESADQQVRQIWAALDEQGIPSLGSTQGASYRPHVTLSVFEHGDPAEITRYLRPVFANVVGLSLPLALVGCFPSEEAPIFLGVVPSAQLISLHHAVHQVIEPLVENIWPYYCPDALLPHCTLAVRVADPARALTIASTSATPILAHVSRAALVEIPTGRTEIQLTTN